jgi:NitT/TauT family transport system ATP-binding protein
MSDRVVVFSPRPAKIIYDTLIPVPRPRTRKDPRIQELIDKVYEFMSR